LRSIASSAVAVPPGGFWSAAASPGYADADGYRLQRFDGSRDDLVPHLLMAGALRARPLVGYTGKPDGTNSA